MKSRIKAQTAVELLQIFWPDFVEVNDLILLPWEANISGKPHQDMTRTEVEVFLSHTHAIDLVQHRMQWEDGQYNHLSPDFEPLCKVGKTLAAMWYEKLQVDFPDYRFRVYYTQDDDPIVRFHRVREGELFWLNEKDYRAEIEQGKVIISDTGQRLATTTKRDRRQRTKRK